MTEPSSQSCQVLVIGGGPGGYLAAIRLAQLKKDVLLVEKDGTLGGVCLNMGCIPSRAFIHVTDFLEQAEEANRMGVRVGPPDIDMKGLVQWKDRIVKKLTEGVGFLVRKNGARIVRGRGQFVSPGEAVVVSEGSETRIRFEQAIIATGSSPGGLDAFPFDGDRVIHAGHALSLDEVPGRLAIVGAGYIGLELGTVFRKLGSRVTLVESKPSLLPEFDKEVGEALAARLGELGAALHLGHTAVSLRPGRPSTLTMQDGQGQIKELDADKILVCVESRPNTGGLGLENLGLGLDNRGFIPVNSRMETAVSGIFAVGDVTGRPLLAHKAYRQARIAAEVVSGAAASFSSASMPGAIYTDPEVAWVGTCEQDARRMGQDIVTGTFPFRASGRALTLDAPEGFVKTIADAKTNKLKGVLMMGRGVSEIISEAALALEMEASLQDLQAIVHPHPTLSEALVESVDAALGQAVHIVNRPPR